MSTPAIIYEDNHLLVVQKPPGFLSQPDGSPRPDMLAWAGACLARNKPGRAYVGLTHRLDRAVGGVMVLARTSKCAARLSRQFRERTVDKIYLALIEGRPEAAGGRLEQTLFRDGALTRPARPGEKGTTAVLEWQLEQSFGRLTLLKVRLLTGFKHQIRAQLAGLGHPIVGDARYGGQRPARGPAIGLWALSLSLDHPTLKDRRTFEAPPARVWPWSLIY